MAIWSLYVIFFGMLVLGLVWLLHQILPEKALCFDAHPYRVCPIPGRWLIPEQVVIVQDILTGGALAGFLVDHFRRRVGRESD